MVDLGDRVMCAPVRAEPIRARLEIRLEDGFEHRLQAGLDHPVSDSGNTELAEFPGISLRDHHLPHLDRPELARFQQVPDLAQELLDPDPGLDLATVALSTPAVRAPALVDTRSHACTRNAGS